jgi:hypothetical protein
MRVTTVLRTIADLVRFPAEFGEAERSVVRNLLELGGYTASDCEPEFTGRRNLPGKRRALARLASVSPS